MTNDKKFALVTGATSGIGYYIARLLAKDGFNLVIVARGEEGLARTAGEFEQAYGIEVIQLSKDLFEPENALAVYNEVKVKGIVVDILVNDAGQGLYGEFKDTDLDRELAIVRLNIASLLVLTKHFLKDMVERGSGKILNLASIAGKLPGPLQAVYHGTKAFVHSFTEAIREEVKDKGVTITSLLPGATETDFFNKAGMTSSKIVVEGKLGSAEEVAKDGYEALMNGDDMVVSGFKNKAQVTMANLTPDSMLAETMHKQQAPADVTEE